MARTKEIRIGSVTIGGDHPVAIQSMTNTDTRDADATVRQIRALEEAGCEIVRVSVYDEACARALPEIRSRIRIPLVADIHFSSRLAILALENGADKVRINPGNIGGDDKVRAVADCARAHRAPIRIGVNSGSLPGDIREKYGVGPRALCESMLRSVRLLESFGFGDLVLSVKSSDVTTMVRSNRELAALTRYPLHLGVTEAGTPETGLVKSAVGIGALLLDGIGDTIRVSLSGDPVQEVAAACSILTASGRRRFGVEIIACPTCGRSTIDVAGLAAEVERRTRHIASPLRVAVMGCVVNGPGEAREADIGVAGGPEYSLLFYNGEVRRKIPSHRILEELMNEIAEALKTQPG
jgi:(E)-4-hydroxy-3-methylbut-2-enyl-diphosphate synthase